MFRYSIGNSDLHNGLTFGWLYKLSKVIQQPYTQYVEYDKSDNTSVILFEVQDGPSRKTMYVTALYFTMTCMTSVGFGNIAAETDNEKIFSICMMIVAGMLVFSYNLAYCFFFLLETQLPIQYICIQFNAFGCEKFTSCCLTVIIG